MLDRGKSRRGWGDRHLSPQESARDEAGTEGWGQVAGAVGGPACFQRWRHGQASTLGGIPGGLVLAGLKGAENGTRGPWGRVSPGQGN